MDVCEIDIREVDATLTRLSNSASRILAGCTSEARHLAKQL